MVLLAAKTQSTFTRRILDLKPIARLSVTTQESIIIGLFVIVMFFAGVIKDHGWNNNFPKIVI